MFENILARFESPDFFCFRNVIENSLRLNSTRSATTTTRSSNILPTFSSRRWRRCRRWVPRTAPTVPAGGRRSRTKICCSVTCQSGKEDRQVSYPV